MTSREFNRDTAGAKRAAGRGPVYITNRGSPAYVLLSFAEYESLTTEGANLVEQLSKSKEVAELEFDPPMSSEPARPATFD